MPHKHRGYQEQRQEQHHATQALQLTGTKTEAAPCHAQASRLTGTKTGAAPCHAKASRLTGTKIGAAPCHTSIAVNRNKDRSSTMPHKHRG